MSHVVHTLGAGAARIEISFHFISLTLFSVGLSNSYSKITNKYQLKQKYKISIDFKINI